MYAVNQTEGHRRLECMIQRHLMQNECHISYLSLVQSWQQNKQGRQDVLFVKSQTEAKLLIKHAFMPVKDCMARSSQGYDIYKIINKARFKSDLRMQLQRVKIEHIDDPLLLQIIY